MRPVIGCLCCSPHSSPARAAFRSRSVWFRSHSKATSAAGRCSTVSAAARARQVTYPLACGRSSFQDADFASLSGARVVRIAVHPDYARMGYGARALQALEAFYTGQLLDLDNVRDDLDDGETFAAVRDRKITKDTSLLQGDEIRVRDAARMPALLQRLSETQTRTARLARCVVRPHTRSCSSFGRRRATRRSGCVRSPTT